MSGTTEKAERQSTPIQDVYDAYAIASLLRMSKNRVWELSNRLNDPLPLRRMEGQRRGGIAFRDELLEWAKRNFNQIGRG